MKTRIINRLFNGLASLRDYEIKKAVIRNESIKLELKNTDRVMTLTPETMKDRAFAISHKKFSSKFNSNQSYELIDFRWVDDKQEANLLFNY